MFSGVQARLFGGGEPTLGPLDAGLQRTQLSPTSWMDVRRGWLAGDDVLFDRLAKAIPWAHGRRQMYDRVVDVPRLTAGLRPPLGLEPVLGDAAVALTAHYGRPVDRLSLALYRDGRDSVAFHGDRMGAMVDDCIVAILSLRGPRRFVVRRKERLAGSKSWALEVGLGDLVVMGGRAQADFEHGIPKVASAGPRLSVMFRSSSVVPRHSGSEEGCPPGIVEWSRGGNCGPDDAVGCVCGL